MCPSKVNHVAKGLRAVRINTRVFGPIEVAESDVISFPGGLYGFESLRRFVLIDVAPDSPCRWLQSVDDGDLSFVVIDPWAVLPDYAPDLPDAEVARLGIGRPEEAVLLVIAVVPEDVRQMTVNLRAPLVVNPRTRQACQVILPGERYPIKHAVFREAPLAGAVQPARGNAAGGASAAVAP